MLPEFEPDGTLPPGIHDCKWREFSKRFGVNARRQELLGYLLILLVDAAAGGAKVIYVDGSFVCNIPTPNDYDACLNILELAEESSLRQLLSDDSDEGQNVLKRRYSGDIRVDMAPVDGSISPYIEFFQRDERKLGKRKGLVRLSTQELHSGPRGF